MNRTRRGVLAASGLALLAGCQTQSMSENTDTTAQRDDHGFDHEYGSWWFDLGGERYNEGESRYWQVIARLWNPDAFREEYRLRRPRVEDADPDSVSKDEWEVRTVTGSRLGMSYQSLRYRGDEGEAKRQELVEKYGDASQIDVLAQRDDV